MSYFADRPLPPVTALDDLISEAAMERPTVTLADLLTPRSRVPRRCRECGGWNGSHHVMCPNGE